MFKNNLLKRLPDAINASISKEFTQVPNQLLRNPDITGKAKALLCLLLSNHDGWISHVSAIKKMMKECEDSIRAGLKELEQVDYLRRMRYRNKEGKKLVGSFWAYTDVQGLFQIDDTLAELDKRGLELFTSNSKTMESLNGKSLDGENPIGENRVIKRLRHKNSNSNNKNVLNSLRNEFKKAKPSSPPTSSSGRLHRRKQKAIEEPSYKQKTLKANRAIPSLLDSASDEVKDIVRLWNSFGKPFTQHNDPNSKIMMRAIKQIQKHLTSHSLEDIKCSIRQYYELLSSPTTSIHFGIPGHVVGLDELFGFSSFTRDRMKKQTEVSKIKSWFDECLPDKDPVGKYISEAHTIPDTYPKMTLKFKRIFSKKVLGGLKGQFTSHDEVCFRRASLKMVAFLKIHRGNLLFGPDERNPLRFVDYVFDAIENQVNGNFTRVTPGWFSNDTLYTKTLPAYLNDQAMVREPEY